MVAATCGVSGFQSEWPRSSKKAACSARIARPHARADDVELQLCIRHGTGSSLGKQLRKCALLALGSLQAGVFAKAT